MPQGQGRWPTAGRSASAACP